MDRIENLPVIEIATVVVPVCGGMPVSIAPISKLYFGIVSLSSIFIVSIYPERGSILNV